MKLPNNDALSEFLDIEDATFEEVPQPQPLSLPPPEANTEVVVYTPISDERADYAKTRKSLENLMKAAEQALEGALMVAESEESARAFEVVAKVLDSAGMAAERMYGLHKKVRDTTDSIPIQQQPINVEKAVFIGTPSDLLDRIEDG